MSNENQSHVAVMVYLLHTRKGKEDINRIIKDVHDAALQKIRKIRQEVVVVKTVAPEAFEEVEQHAIRRLYQIFKSTAEALKKIYNDFCLLKKHIIVPTIADVKLLIREWCNGLKANVFSVN